MSRRTMEGGIWRAAPSYPSEAKNEFLDKRGEINPDKATDLKTKIEQLDISGQERKKLSDQLEALLKKNESVNNDAKKGKSDQAELALEEESRREKIARLQQELSNYRDHPEPKIRHQVDPITARRANKNAYARGKEEKAKPKTKPSKYQY